MKKLFCAIAVLALAVVACKKNEPVPQLVVDFSINPNPVIEGEEAQFVANVSGGVAPYSYAWKVGDVVSLTGAEAKWVAAEKGTYAVTLTATDAKGSSLSRSKNLVVEPKPIVATGEVTLLWTAQLEGYSAITSPAIADDGSIYTATRDKNHFYKISKTGEIVWTKELLKNPQSGSNIYGTPSIDADGTIFMVGGDKGGDATLVAYNPDGSEKWRFTDFWNSNGGAHSAKIEGANVAGIGDNNVYIGNTGTTGTVMAISKADGQRVNFIKESNGGGPAGGLRAGVVISNTGRLGWNGGAYGVFTAAQSALDTPGEGTPSASRSIYSHQAGWPDGNNQGPVAIMKIGDKNCIVGTLSLKADNAEQVQNPQAARTVVYAVDMATGEEVAKVKVDQCAKQDQGGVAITEEGYIVAGLKYTAGKDDGGIVLVDPVQNVQVGHYGLAENVACPPAIDQAGNIHFGTEAGNYYVVKYKGNGEFETLVKKDIAELVANDSRYSQAFAHLTETIEESGKRNFAKIWSGIVIGDDGTILIQFTDNDNRAVGGLAAINVDYTTGPSTQSPWPMMGQNRKHTNRQK